jgi:uncharacterized protein DUF4157
MTFARASQNASVPDSGRSGTVPPAQVLPAPGLARDEMRLPKVQRTQGNQAVLRMLSVSACGADKVHRKCSCGSTGSGAGECPECKSQDGVGVDRAAAGSKASGPVPSIVNQVLRSSGQPIDASMRTSMEDRFGYDFGAVRFHTDATAAQSAAAVSALAYTVGRHVVFGASQYSPGSDEGRRLIAHELAHVVQQGGGDDVSPQTVSDPADASEHQADRAADAAMSVRCARG